MKQSLIQSQLTINAFLISMIEKDIECCKATVKYVNSVLNSEETYSGRYIAGLTLDKQNSIKQMQYGRKKLAKLVELQKSLKKQASRHVLLYRKQKRLAKEIGKNPWNVAELRYNLDRVLDEIIARDYY